MSWLVLAGVVVTFLTSVTGFLASIGNRRKIAEVHVLVNSQLNTVLSRVAQLTGTLESAGIDVPPQPDET